MGPVNEVYGHGLTTSTVIKLLNLHADGRDLWKTQWHYSCLSVIFKQHIRSGKGRSDGMVFVRDLKAQGQGKQSLRVRRDCGWSSQRTSLWELNEGRWQWHCEDIGILVMSPPSFARHQTSIWCHLIKTRVPGGDIQHHESNETSANSYNSKTKQAKKWQNKQRYIDITNFGTHIPTEHKKHLKFPHY